MKLKLTIAGLRAAEKHLALAIAALLLVLSVQACTGATVPEDVRGFAGSACGGERPEAWYGRQFSAFHQNRLEEADERLGPTPDAGVIRMVEASFDPRQLNFAAVEAQYAETALECWANADDQLAGLVLATRLLNRNGADLARAEQFLRAASAGEDLALDAGNLALPDSCNSSLAAGQPHCRFGLPEAQAALGRLMCRSTDPREKEEGNLLLWRAYRGGLWPASSEAASNC